LLLCVCFRLGPAAFGAPEPAQVVRHAVVDGSVPVFVPVHPRIATTVSFPRPIGAPMGTGFVEADALERAAAEGKAVNHRGEYVITYLAGDSFFTVQPLQRGELINLNVPFEGQTVVIYFYGVEHPLSAVASLVFSEKQAEARVSSASVSRADASRLAGGAAPTLSRVEKLPSSPYKPASPARLEGFLRKLRLVHAAMPGPELEDAAKALNLKVVLSTLEQQEGAAITHPVSDHGSFEIILLRAARDPTLDAVGFVVLLRSKSERELIFDLRTFSARCGAALYTAAVIDAPAMLKPGEVKAGYLAIVGAGDERPAHVSAENDWRISVSLVNADSEAATSQRTHP
jgi:hypothetical protein